MMWLEDTQKLRGMHADIVSCTIGMAMIPTAHIATDPWLRPPVDPRELEIDPRNGMKVSANPVLVIRD